MSSKHGSYKKYGGDTVKITRHSKFNKLLMFDFESNDFMTKCFERFSNFYEGFVPGRIGYNMPTSYVIDFALLKRDTPLSKEEMFIYSTINKEDTGGYVIAYLRGDDLTRRHEFQHAKYFFSYDFRKEVDSMWEKLPERIRSKYISRLHSLGYSDSVLIDEFQAYYFTGEICFHT